MKKSFFLILIAFIAFASKSQNYFETLIPTDDGVFREGKFVVLSRLFENRFEKSVETEK